MNEDAIPIDQLQDNTPYRGCTASGRHGQDVVMVWKEKDQMFEYQRTKFQFTFNDLMHHENDPNRPSGIEGFVPLYQEQHDLEE